LLAVTELQVALAGVISTAVLGVSAPLIAWRVTVSQRRHERQLANDARLFDKRTVAYEDAVEFAQRLALGIDADDLPATRATFNALHGEEVPRLTARLLTFGTRAAASSFREFLESLAPVRALLDQSHTVPEADDAAWERWMDELREAGGRPTGQASSSRPSVATSLRDPNLASDGGNRYTVSAAAAS
jgi:hypothetical protein